MYFIILSNVLGVLTVLGSFMLFYLLQLCQSYSIVVFISIIAESTEGKSPLPRHLVHGSVIVLPNLP